MDPAFVARLVATFVREAKRRLSELEEDLRVLELGLSDAAVVGSLGRLFHGFAGVGGVPGFEMINELGSRGEGECRQLLAANATPSREQLLAWRLLADGLRSEIGQLEAAYPPRRLRESPRRGD